MPNLALIAKDDRVRKQIEQFLAELEMDDLRVASFKDHKEFQDSYYRSRVESLPDPAPDEDKQKDQPSADPTVETTELKLFSELNLVLFALDSITSKPGPWIDDLRLNLKKFGYYPKMQNFRVIMLKYEDDGISKLDVMHPFLDDLIYMPIDRLVFLQKLQIILELPKRNTPRFLFNQEIRVPIEISKISRLDRLSDVAMAIRNPVPLRPGLPGHFYITMPGDKGPTPVRGKVIKSVPHPEFPDQHLVYFSYFGLNRTQLTSIRRVLSKAPRYQSLINHDFSRFRFREDDLFMPENEKRRLGLAIIDSDEAIGQNLAQQVMKDMDKVDVVTETSYSVFYFKYFDAKSDRPLDKPPEPTDESDFYANPIVMTVSTSDQKCLSVEPGPDEDDLFLGFPAHGVFSAPDRWLSMITNKASRLMIEEAVQLASRGRPLSRIALMQDSQSRTRALSLTFSNGETSSSVKIEIRPANLVEIMSRMTSDKKSTNLDAILLDTNFLPEDPAGWIENMRIRAHQMNLTKQTGDLKFIVMSENETRLNSFVINNRDILGYLIKPIDSRQLLFLVSEHLNNPHTLYKFDNLGWAQPNLPVHIAKDIELEALSEFGATLKTAQKLTPGTMVYLRKSIYDNAPNACLAARVYACEDHPSDKGQYLVHVTYFGIADAFLKFARTWIRETYANSKNPDQ